MTDISVIIPTYKPGAYLRECLDSMWTQTLGHDRFEVILVLNGCNEPYRSTIENLLKEAPRDMDVRFIQTDQGGVSNARNMGLDLAKGQYVCFIDDDDWVSPSYLEGLLDVVSGESDMAIANVQNYNEVTGKMQSDWLTNCYEKNACQSGKASLMSCRSFMSVACCKITSRAAIGQYRFNSHFTQGEDSLFNAEMSHRLTHFGVAQRDVIYYRRLRVTSAARSISKETLVRENTRLALAFVKTYLKDIRHYDFLFFASRVMACVKGTMRRISSLS